MKLYKAGLPLSFEENLIFESSLPAVNPDIRTLKQMLPVLKNKGVSKPKNCYFMYRGIALPADLEIFNKYSFRYDITVISSAKLGDEFNKTFGHYHPFVPGTSTCFPEVYEVLNGRAYYMIQKPSKDPKVVEDIAFFDAKKGDKVVVPPGYGHVTINPGDEALIMSNLVFSGFSSVYGSFKKLRGGAYYETVNGWIKNTKYKDVPELRKIRPKKLFSRIPFIPEQPLYKMFVKDPEKFLFLSKPQDFPNFFKRFLE